MQIFSDNDALVKIAHCDLVDECCQLFAGGQYKVLSTFEGWIKGRQKKSAYHPNVFALLKPHQSNRFEIDLAAFELVADLNGIPDLDPGELLLFAKCASTQDSVVFTSDKRAIIALSNQGTPTLVSGLRGKIWTVEQVVFKLIAAHGFEYVSKRVCNTFAGDLSFDNALKSAFSGGYDPDERNCLECLSKYIEDLREESGSLLAAS